MYTSTKNHIVLQLIKSNSFFVRIEPVTHIDEFKDEYNVVYDESPVENLVIIYNQARWCERLICDLKYKKFKDVKIEKYRDGIWSVSCLNWDAAVSWFYNHFEPYLKFKLISYCEDNIDEHSIIDKIENLQYQIKTDEYLDEIRKNIDDETCFKGVLKGFKLKKPEKFDDEYVLTSDGLIGIVLFSLSHFIDTLALTKETYSKINDLQIRQCEFTGCYFMNKDIIDLKEVPFFLKEVGIKKDDIEKLRYCSVYKRYVEKNICNEIEYYPLMNKTAIGFSFIDENVCLGTTELDIQSLRNLPFINENTVQAEYELQRKRVDAADIHVLSKQAEEKSNMEGCAPGYLYKNHITGHLKRYPHEIHIVKELELISKINVKTNIGRDMFDTLLEINENEVADIINELLSFIDILNLVFKKGPNAIAVPNSTRSVVCMDIQKKHTSYYVDTYKDDNSETLASQAIEKVFTYLSNYIMPKDINMNKIGQDLVDLGVKKTRKAKGNVYGIVNPSKKEIEELVTGSKSSKN